MEGARLSRNELNNLIVYALEKNNVDTVNLDMSEIYHIINNYMYHCDYFKRNYVNGELDTFKRAACLLVAINNSRIVRDERVRASVALDAAYKWIETPVWNVGVNHDEPQAMETVNFDDVFSDDMETFNHSKNMLIDALVYESGLPINYNLNLELLYYCAIEKKKRKLNNNEEVKEVVEVPVVELPKKQNLLTKALRFIGIK